MNMTQLKEVEAYVVDSMRAAIPASIIVEQWTMDIHEGYPEVTTQQFLAAMNRNAFLHQVCTTYMVGGCVRDELMGLEYNDIDYCVVGCTDTELMFAHGFTQVGADFPVFLHPITGEEYALARTERKSGAGYHGFETDILNVTIEEDLFRRDLTVNAIAKNVITCEIIDPFGGQADIESRTLRMVNPETFIEDPLRAVRLIRFVARWSHLGFRLDCDTLVAVFDMINKGALNELPYERFIAEIRKVYDDAITWAKRDPEVSEKIVTTFWDYVITSRIWECNFFRTLINNSVDAINEVERSHKRIINSPKVDDYDLDMAMTVALATIGTFHSNKPEVGSPHYDLIKQFNTTAADVVRFTVRARELISACVDDEEFDDATFTKKMNALMHTFRVHQRDLPFVNIMDVFNVGTGAPLPDLFKRINAAYVMINAESFPGLEGIQLGEAIVAKRCEVMAEIMLNLP